MWWEAEEAPNFLQTCSTVAQDGQVIYTESERVVRTRKTSIELLMSDTAATAGVPVCSTAPPTSMQGYVQAIARGDDKEAVRIIKERLPAPLGGFVPSLCLDYRSYVWIDGGTF